jgi:hypothetical protein
MIKDFVGEADGYVADVEVLDEQPAPDVPDLILMKTKAYFGGHLFRQKVDAAKQGDPPQIKPPFERVRDPGRLADMIASHIELSIPDKQALLATLDPVRRLERVGDLLQGKNEISRPPPAMSRWWPPFTARRSAAVSRLRSPVISGSRVKEAKRLRSAKGHERSLRQSGSVVRCSKQPT